MLLLVASMETLHRKSLTLPDLTQFCTSSPHSHKSMSSQKMFAAIENFETDIEADNTATDTDHVKPPFMSDDSDNSCSKPRSFNFRQFKNVNRVLHIQRLSRSKALQQFVDRMQAMEDPVSASPDLEINRNIMLALIFRYIPNEARWSSYSAQDKQNLKEVADIVTPKTISVRKILPDGQEKIAAVSYWVTEKAYSAFHRAKWGAILKEMSGVPSPETNEKLFRVLKSIYHSKTLLFLIS